LEDLGSLGVKIRRDVSIQLFPFTEFFHGFENVQGIRALFGEKTAEVLNNLRIEFYSAHFGYMSVSEEDGHILVSAYHLRTSDPIVIYLDIFHELHHVKQFMDGKALFLTEFEYVDSPIELEAYLATVREARRIGMNEEKILEYLKIEWLTEEQLYRLAKSVGLETKQKGI